MPSSKNRIESNQDVNTVRIPETKCDSLQKVARPYLAYFQYIQIVPRLKTTTGKVLLLLGIILNLLAYGQCAVVCYSIFKPPLRMDAGSVWIWAMGFQFAYSAVVYTIQIYQGCKDRYYEYFALIDKVIQCREGGCIVPEYFQKLRRKYKIFIIIASTGILLNAVFHTFSQVSVSFVQDDPVSSLVSGPLYLFSNSTMSVSPRILIWRLFFVSFNIIGNCLWLYSLFLHSFLLWPLLDLLKAFTESLRQECKENDNHITNLYEKRQFYLQIVKVVGKADQLLGFQLTATFLYGLLCPMLILYGIITFPIPSEEGRDYVAAMSAFWIGFGLIYLLFPVLIAGRVSDECSSPLTVIQEAKISEETRDELFLFLNILKHHNFGINCMGLFRVEKSMAASLIGIFVTYFFLLVQLKGVFEFEHATTTAASTTMNSLKQNTVFFG